MRLSVRSLLALSVCAWAVSVPARGEIIGYTTDTVIPHLETLDDAILSEAWDDLEDDGHTLVRVDSLAPGPLAGLDTLVVGVVKNGFALSPSQVDVIESFVLDGGKLVFLGENNAFFHANNVAVGGRFGIEYPTADPSDTVMTDVPLPRHPVMDGPHGVVNSIDGSGNAATFYGSMSSPGPHGRSFLDFPGGNSAGVVIEPDALGLDSGLVIALAEITVWENPLYGEDDNRALWRNIFAYVPEPATLSLLVIGGLAMVCRRRR